MAVIGATREPSVGTEPEGAGAVPAERRRRRRAPSLLHNRKALIGATLLAIFAVMAAIPGVIAPYDPSAEMFDPQLPPSCPSPRTTAYGQDVFSQLIWGARASLIVALAVGALSTLLAVMVGVSAAYLGGIWDGTLSIVTDVLLVVPAFPLIVVIAAYTNGANMWMLIAVLVVTGWSFGARQLRSQMLSLKRREFLEAAKARGGAPFLHRGVRGHPDHDFIDRGQFSYRGVVRRSRRGGVAVRGPRQPVQLELGHDALLGAKQRSP